MGDVNLNIQGNELKNGSNLNVNFNINSQIDKNLNCNRDYPVFTKDFIKRVDYKHSYFIGREGELKQIEEDLLSGYPIVFIEGVAGIGKSYLVKKFLIKAYEEKKFNCFGYISLASIEGINSEEDKKKFLTLVYESFTSNFDYDYGKSNKAKDKFIKKK